MLIARYATDGWMDGWMDEYVHAAIVACGSAARLKTLITLFTCLFTAYVERMTVQNDDFLVAVDEPDVLSTEVIQDNKGNPPTDHTGIDATNWCAYPSTPRTPESNAFAYPFHTKLRTLWLRIRAKFSWLVVYTLLNGAGIVWRFLWYPEDSAVWFWPGIAKGSSEAILINTALVLLSVCFHGIRKLRSLLGKAPPSVFAAMHPTVDNHITLHKLAGSVVLIASLVHSIAWVWMLIALRRCSESDWTQSAYHHHLFLRYSPVLELLGKLPIWTGVLMLVCVIAAIPFCLSCVRRRSYKMFVLMHMAFAPLTALLLIHGAARWMSGLQAPYWLMAPLILYFWEYRQRRKLAYTETQVVRCEHQHDVMILTLTKPPRFQKRVKPGMFVFVQVPELSRVEWHPFSICSTPHDEHLELRIQKVGDWTRALSDVLQQQQLTIRVNGPMATPTQHFDRYEVVALIAAGIGVTPFLSVVRHMLLTWRQEQLQQRPHPALLASRQERQCYPKKVCFIWSTRDSQRLEWVLSIVNEFQDVLADPKYVHAIEFHVYITSRASTGNAILADLLSPHALPYCVIVHYERPNWSSVLAHIGTAQWGHSIGVFLCMNRQLTTRVKHEIATYNATIASGHMSHRPPPLDAFAETF